VQHSSVPLTTEALSRARARQRDQAPTGRPQHRGTGRHTADAELGNLVVAKPAPLPGPPYPPGPESNSWCGDETSTSPRSASETAAGGWFVGPAAVTAATAALGRHQLPPLSGPCHYTNLHLKHNLEQIDGATVGNTPAPAPHRVSAHRLELVGNAGRRVPPFTGRHPALTGSPGHQIPPHARATSVGSIPPSHLVV
jgi:hypothetical protein